MKILMLCEFYREDMEYQENLLLKYYLKHGHEVVILTSTFKTVFDFYKNNYDNKIPPSEERIAALLVVRLQFAYNMFGKLRKFTPIGKLLEREAPDLIFVHSILPNMVDIVDYLKGAPSCRLILDYHGDSSNSANIPFSEAILHRIVRGRYLRLARPFISKIFPVVPASAEFLNRVYGIPYDDMEVLPLGADTDLAFSIKRGSARMEIRKCLGLAEDRLLVFTGGKLTPVKKTELLLGALSHPSLKEVHVVIVGDSDAAEIDYKESLLRLGRARGNVHFVGWLGREDVYRYLCAADVATFPASQSIIWQQAIAMGLPLVVGDTGDQDISYLNLKDNIVILRGDQLSVRGIRDALERILLDPDRMMQMRRGAEQVAADELDWNRLIQRTLRYN